MKKQRWVARGRLWGVIRTFRITFRCWTRKVELMIAKLVGSADNWIAYERSEDGDEFFGELNFWEANNGLLGTKHNRLSYFSIFFVIMEVPRALVLNKCVFFHLKPSWDASNVYASMRYYFQPFKCRNAKVSIFSSFFLLFHSLRLLFWLRMIWSGEGSGVRLF